jgi:hypothetical protein
MEEVSPPGLERRIVADQAVDIVALKDVIGRKW